MAEHVRAIGIVSILRSLVEQGLGGYLLATAYLWKAGSGFFELRGVPDSADRTTFFAVGLFLCLLSMVRFVQAVQSLRVRDWARRLGLWLGSIDFILPITLPFALWSFVVYRHNDTRDYFRRQGR
ncbi:MAG: hypothetical protein AAF517_18225 [Planctomycetota bacterium]